MSAIEVTTQKQLDAALKKAKTDDWIVCLGGTRWDPLVVSGSASVEAYGSASVEASGSASVEAYGSASVRASGSASVRAYDSASVRASASVPVQKYPSHHGTIKGGVIIDVPDPSKLSPTGWLDWCGVSKSRGYAVMFKAVDADFATDHSRAKGIVYTPGAKVEAPDWDTTPQCGGGLHVSATPWLARQYNSSATRYVAVRVRVAELVVLGDKAKVPRLTVMFECDLDGEPVAAETV